MKTTNLVALFLLCTTMGFLLGARCTKSRECVFTRTDTLTIVKTDTVTERIPVPQISFLRDTILIRDTIILRERKVYATDKYRAVVSGFQARLDTLVTYPVVVTKVVRPKRHRWSVGPYVGVDARLQPSIGLSVQYRLFSW